MESGKQAQYTGLERCLDSRYSNVVVPTTKLNIDPDLGVQYLIDNIVRDILPMILS